MRPKLTDCPKRCHVFTFSAIFKRARNWALAQNSFRYPILSENHHFLKIVNFQSDHLFPYMGYLDDQWITLIQQKSPVLKWYFMHRNEYEKWRLFASKTRKGMRFRIRGLKEGAFIQCKYFVISLKFHDNWSSFRFGCGKVETLENKKV